MIPTSHDVTVRRWRRWFHRALRTLSLDDTLREQAWDALVRVSTAVRDGAELSAAQRERLEALVCDALALDGMRRTSDVERLADRVRRDASALLAELQGGADRDDG